MHKWCILLCIQCMYIATGGNVGFSCIRRTRLRSMQHVASLDGSLQRGRMHATTWSAGRFRTTAFRRSTHSVHGLHAKQRGRWRLLRPRLPCAASSRAQRPSSQHRRDFNGASYGMIKVEGRQAKLLWEAIKGDMEFLYGREAKE